jgi:D-alanyl-D-alanine dipeptidase
MIDYYKPIPDVEFLTDKIPVSEPSGETLVYLDDVFVCDSKYYRWAEMDGAALPGSSPSIMCRKTVCEMLKRAEALLPEGYRFVIYDAYRPISVQQALWDHFRAQKAKEFPDASPEEIDRQTQFCVSLPSYDIHLPSLHNTGGAVDLTIAGPDGRELDMGCEFDEFTGRAWTVYYEDGSEGAGLNDAARDNRRLLYNVMTSAGFTNFPAEWWHFDYGDEKWALYTGKRPIYAGILDAKVRNSV